ncbi:14715_t:CDS:2 [Funneliformis caledonium]|uniref:14715_t:CDS:1 n=1 Tax=Funneliformis caledonium TaxID=1117310 RepID=A0A9N8VEP1_9GLOM|nr:14715_t:CDS:2 [Funneliformis caledonium]
MTILPSEIFVEICRFLSPWELDSVSFVCRKFRVLLTCPSSLTTMHIWRTSRKSTIFFPQLPLPEGINERDYCLISMLERGCQFCSDKLDYVRIYWIFRVRSCWACLMIRTKRISQRESVPDFAAGLPFATIREEGMFGYECKAFWKSDFELAEVEFSNIKKSERMKWIEEKRANREHLLTDALERDNAEKKFREISNLAKFEKVRSFGFKLMQDVCCNFNKIRLCPTFNETIALPDHLFAKVTFQTWRDKIIKEYHENEKEYSIRVRYNQINERLFYTLGSLIVWKEHCATYKSPPYVDHDPRKPWSEEFLDNIIVPRILTEAIECEKKARCAKKALQSVESLIFENVKSAISFGLGGENIELSNSNNNKGLEIFRCKICEKNSNHLLYFYLNIKKHLHKRHNSLDLEYIELDYNIMHKHFVNFSNNWFKTGVYPYNLSDEYMKILKDHHMPWWD